MTRDSVSVRSGTGGTRSEPVSVTDELAVAVLGVGNIGSVHLQSVEAFEGASVVAAADAVAENRAKALELGADNVYGEYQELLGAETVDVAIIALPPSLHRVAAESAMERGCDVFVEKPFARTVAEARSIESTAERIGRTVGVDHTLRYQDGVRAVKKAYDRGELGHVPLCTLRRVNHGPFASPPDEASVSEWQLDPQLTGGGALLDLGVHLFDVLEWTVGECELVDASVESTLDLPYEDVACVQLRAVERDTIATVQCGFFQWEDPPEVNCSVRFEGIVDSIESADHTPEHFPLYAAKSAATNLARSLLGGEPNYLEPTYYYRAHYRALTEFLAALRTGRPAPVDARDGVRTIELVEAAYEAAEPDYREEEPPTPTIGETS